MSASEEKSSQRLKAVEDELQSTVAALEHAHRAFESREKTLQREVSELQNVLNEKDAILSELKSTQTQLVQSQKLAALGEMIAGIAHDMNNALTPILGFSQLLLEDEKDKASQEQDTEGNQVCPV